MDVGEKMGVWEEGRARELRLVYKIKIVKNIKLIKIVLFNKNEMC